jgi:hypothetical protein
MKSLLLVILSLVVGAAVALYLTGQLDTFVQVGGGLVRRGGDRADDSAYAAAISPEAAAAAEEKLRRLGAGEEVRLTDSEVNSLFRYRPEVWSLGGMKSPMVRMRGDTLWLSGAVDPEYLPPHPALDAVRMILPDTVRVDLAGTVAPFNERNAAVEVGSVEIAGMPFPARYFPEIIARLGFPEQPGLPERAVALPLPAGIRSARVADGELILTS